MQAERFTNLADPVLDAMKQLTPLAFDILTFIVIDKLATPTTSDGKQRNKMKVLSSTVGSLHGSTVPEAADVYPPPPLLP